MTQEALKLALEALEKYCTPYLDGTHPADEAITAIKEALAQTEQEPVAWVVYSSAENDIVWADKGKRLKQNTPLYTTPSQPEQEPVAWRTFDGEGGYDYRSYEDNESYADEWDKRNPNHKGWVDKLYTTPPPCPTCEALARTVMMDQTGRDA